MRRLKFIYLLLFQAFLLLSGAGFGQTSGNANVVFSVNDAHLSCFDAAEIDEWKGHYQRFSTASGALSTIPVLSVQPNQSSTITVTVANKQFKTKWIDFKIIGDPSVKVNVEELSGGRFELTLPAREENYSLEVIYNGEQRIGQLDLRVYAERQVEVILVPLVQSELDTQMLRAYINRIYAPTRISFKMTQDALFDPSIFRSIATFNSPSLEYRQYTNQMQEVRDEYFQQIPNYNQNAIYIFLIPGFRYAQISEYAVLGKSLGFVVYQSDTTQLYRSIARSIGLGMGHLSVSWEGAGPARMSTDNLMDDDSGTALCAWQWDHIRVMLGSTSYFDDYEQVIAENGKVAYFFWEEDEQGNIRLWDNDLMSSIRHPFKRNVQSYHLNIDDFLYETRFTLWERKVSFWHMILVVFGIGLAALLKKRLDRAIESRFQRQFFLKAMVKVFGLALGFGILYYGFMRIQRNYAQFVVKSGPVKELKGMTEFQAIREVRQNKKMQGSDEESLCNEVLVHKKNQWIKSKRKPVLYFNVTVQKEQLVQCTFDHDSDYLTVTSEKYSKKSASQYMVFSFKDQAGKPIRQEVYNYKGNEITSLLHVHDPAKRILLFVNGYRSSSTANNFQDQVWDLENKGFELPSSTNLIYTFDRFRYWYYKEFDTKLRERINPSETYYADGNFSISTSNYRTIRSFIQMNSIYPKRCVNEYHHTCYHSSSTAKWLSLFQSDYTIDLLRKPSNKSGFKTRMENGRVAGQNLLQMLNEVPNKSKNDTLFIVAHSMGYAYALGMIEELRGKINFGGFYIIAPENGEAGYVNAKEWRELWQYGANFNRGEEDAPCIQDGIAPQTAVGGLGKMHRIYIPKSLYAKRGFSDSHFIGLYKFLFDIPAGKKGHVQQH